MTHGESTHDDRRAYFLLAKPRKKLQHALIGILGATVNLQEESLITSHYPPGHQSLNGLPEGRNCGVGSALEVDGQAIDIEDLPAR
jgi:hypothetical protein